MGNDLMDPKHLYWLAAIIEHGNMSRASEKLRITQPTLSQAIKVLEAQVGSPVLKRGPRGVTPTLIGERLAKQGRKISTSKHLAEEAVALWNKGLTSELRIGVGPMLAHTVMGDFLSGYVDQNPSNSLRLKTATASALINDLHNGDLDILLAPAQLSLLKDELVQKFLFSDQLAVFARRDHPLSKLPGPLSSEQLMNYDYIITGAYSAIYGSTKEALQQQGIIMRSIPMYFTGDIQMAMEVLKKSDCLCVLGSKLAQFSRFKDDIVQLNLNRTLPDRDVVAWTTKEMFERQEIVSFIEQFSRFAATKGLTTVE